MGAAPSRRAARAIARCGVSYAVDLRAKPVGASTWPPTVQTFSCPFEEYEAPDLAALSAISKQIAALIESGEIVYVHCRAGVQRAPLVACAVLVNMGWTLGNAVRLVSTRRAVAAMTESQLAVLREMEGLTIWLTELSGAGKTTVANGVAAGLEDEGHPVDPYEEPVAADVVLNTDAETDGQSVERALAAVRTALRVRGASASDVASSPSPVVLG